MSNGGSFKSIDSNSSTPTNELNTSNNSSNKEQEQVNGNSQHPRVYDNVPTTSPEAPISTEKTTSPTTSQSNSSSVTSSSMMATDGWRLGSGLRPPRRIDDTNLPPAPPPPSSSLFFSRSHQTNGTSSTNGFGGLGEDRGRYNGSNPPTIAPKPNITNYTPKNIDLANYRQRKLHTFYYRLHFLTVDAQFIH